MNRQKIAITGGIATGKSTVASMFSRLGAIILDADQVAREAVEPSSPCHPALRALLGPSYFDENHRLLRQKLREGIIQNPELREEVNALLHPFILSSMDEKWRDLGTKEPQRLVLFDIPLLFEIHFESHFHMILLAYVPPHVQIQRLMERDGLTHEAAEKTLSMQWPIESKRKKSHVVIDNSGSLENTWNQVRHTWKKLTGKEACEGEAGQEPGILASEGQERVPP